MAIDVVKERLSAANILLNEGFLLTVEQPIFTGKVKTGTTSKTAWAVQTSQTRMREKDSNTLVDVLKMTISALEYSAGAFGSVLHLNVGDHVVLNGVRKPIINPGPVTPKRAASGASDPIVYRAIVSDEGAPRA